MGLISKTVKVKWNATIKKYYEAVEFFTSMPEMDETAKKDMIIADCPHTIACGRTSWSIR